MAAKDNVPALDLGGTQRRHGCIVDVPRCQEAIGFSALINQPRNPKMLVGVQL